MKEASHTIQRRESGFSLAEVLVAVALLAVIMLALFSLVSMGVQRAYSGRKMTESTMLAQTVMERVNVYAPHLALTTDTSLETISETWSKTPSEVTPDLVSGSSFQAAERNAIRTMLEDATSLQVYEDRPATLTVSMTAVPEANPSAVPAVPAHTFANASMVRVVVELTWFEWGTRRRQVRLQALNLRTTP